MWNSKADICCRRWSKFLWSLWEHQNCVGIYFSAWFLLSRSSFLSQNIYVECQLSVYFHFVFVYRCFTTEILEGFDVQRTSCLTDTLKKYCYLTSTISKYYKEIFYEASEDSKICLLYDEFVQKCHYLDKMTASDVFGVQLMQVILSLYLLSLCTVSGTLYYDYCLGRQLSWHIITYIKGCME